jgi:hypothetical protein
MGREYTDQAQFNLGLLYLQGTYGILRTISTAFMNSDRQKVILGLRTLYREVACKLKPNERESIDSLFRKLHPYLKKEQELKKQLKEDQRLRNETDTKTKINRINNIIFRLLEDIDISLRDYFEKKGLLIPNKRDFTRFENLE